MSPALGVIARSGALPSALVAYTTSPLLSELRDTASVDPARSNADTLPSSTTVSTAPLASETRNSGCWPSACAVVYSHWPSADRVMPSADASHFGASSLALPVARSIAISAKRSASKPGRAIAR